jgi:hypothetical protein
LQISRRHGRNSEPTTIFARNLCKKYNLLKGSWQVGPACRAVTSSADRFHMLIAGVFGASWSSGLSLRKWR